MASVRSKYVRIKLPEELTDYVAYIAQKRLLGYRSMIEFTCACVRKEVQYLQELGVVPPSVPKVRTVAPGAIGVLSAVLGVALLALLALLPGKVTGMGTLTDLLSPLADWNVLETYARFKAAINFILYFGTMFTLVFAGLGDRFSKGITVGLSTFVGIALAIALSLLPIEWMAQLAPMVFLFFILGIFYLIFEGFRTFGLTGFSSGAAAYILAFLLVGTHAPDVFEAAGYFGTILKLTFIVTVIYAIYLATHSFSDYGEDIGARAGHAARSAWADSFGSEEDKRAIQEEQAAVRDALSLQPQAYRRATDMASALGRVSQAVHEYGYDREALATIADELRTLRGQSTESSERLGKLQALATRLQAMDLALFTKLKDKVAKLPKAEQKRVNKAIGDRVAQLKLDAILPKLATASKNAQQQADKALAKASTLLEKNKAHHALRSIEQARYHIGTLKGLLSQIEDIEQSIQALLNRTLRYFK